MKTLFVTYTQDGLVKKGRITEDRYNALRADASVSNMILYPSELLMENNYAAITCNDGSCGNRGYLFS
jgi:hypothetical protein